MNTDTETLVNVLNERLKYMTPEDRISTLSDIFSGYCPYCGGEQKENEMPCQCWNDE